MFSIAFIQVAITLAFIVPGFLLKKFNKLKEEHLSGLSVVLIYVCSPCLIISSFFSLEFSTELLIKAGWFLLVTLLLQSAFIALAFLFIPNKKSAAERVVSVGGVLGNVGFFGLPLIRSVLPNNPEVACYSATYVFSMNVLVFTVGAFCLTGEKKHVSLKSAILNPSTLAFFAGVILFLLRVNEFLPAAVSNAITVFGSASTGLCMVILGARLATVGFKTPFKSGHAYVATLLKLLIFPLFCYAAVYFLPFDSAFKISILLLSGAPCASVLVGLAEMHESETALAASCVLLSTLCCIITVPLLSLLI